MRTWSKWALLAFGIALLHAGLGLTAALERPEKALPIVLLAGFWLVVFGILRRPD